MNKREEEERRMALRRIAVRQAIQKLLKKKVKKGNPAANFK